MGRRRGLDGLRALAIAAVVLCHSDPGHFQGGGIAGVDLFFVLSGFLITKLLLAECDRIGRIALTSFYVRRARRLLPALVTLLVVVVAVEAVTGGQHQRGVALLSALIAVGYASNVARHAGFLPTPALAHLWTLALEEQFYLVWPLALTLGLRKVRRPLIVAATLCLIAVAFFARLHAVASGDPSIYYAPTTWADALLVGCLAGQLHAWGYLAWLRSRPFVWVALVPFVFVTVTTVQWTDLYRGQLLVLAVANAFAVVLAANRPPAILESRAATWLGRRSYSLYLWHTPILLALLAITGGVASAPSLPVACCAALLAVVVAAASYRWIERPFLSPGRRLRRGDTSRPTVEASTAIG